MKSKTAAFSLLELMIIVALLADIAIVAVPSYIRARNTVQNTRFISDLRIATSSFELYAAETNRYPANATQGVIPSGMASYLTGMNWTQGTPIGGRWDWEPTTANPARVGVRYISPQVGDDVRLADIDSRVDNGALSTGGFRKISSTLYLHIIE